MESFWDFVKILVIVNGALVALFLILVSLPQSSLRKITLKVFGIINYIIAIFLLLYVINPIDLLPDIIPVLGQSDDVAGLSGAIIDGIIGYISLEKSQEKIPKRS
jgi:hypothetical protein